MYSRNIHRLLIGLVGVAAIALSVPSLGLGAVIRDDESGGLSIGAAVVTSVPSQIRPDNRIGPLGAQPITAGYSASDAFTRAVARHQASESAGTSLRPDNRSGPFGAKPITAGYSASGATSLRPDNRLGPLGAQPITADSGTVAASLPAASVASDTFQWWDAAVGAGSVLAVCALLLAAMTVQRQHRRSVVAH